MAKSNTWKKCYTSSQYVSETTYLRQSDPRKSPGRLSRWPNGRHGAQFDYIVCTTGEKVLQRVDKSQGNLFIWQISAKNPWKKFARSRKLNQNPLLYTLFEKFLNWSDVHHFEACWTPLTLDNTEIFLENFLWKISPEILWKNQKNFGLQLNATNASHSIPSPALGWHTWDTRPEKCDKVNICPVIKNWVFVCFRQKLPGEKLSATEKFGPVNHYLANAAKQ